MSGHWRAFRAAWRRRHENTPSNRPALEQAFLPAALEIHATPPSPIGRAIMLSVILVFVLAVGWAVVGRVDIVSVAKGKIIPDGNTKVIQPLEIGVVKAIHVHDGQHVMAGDRLLELKHADLNEDHQRLLHDSQMLRAERRRLIALIAQLGGDTTKPAPPLDLPDDIPAVIRRQQQQLYIQLLDSHRARRDELQATIAQQQAEARASRESLNKQQAILPIVTKRMNALKKLLAGKMAAETDYLELKQQQIEIRQDIRIEKQRLREIGKRIDQTRARLRQHGHQARGGWLTELSDAETKLAQTRHELEKVKARIARLTLSSPVDGVVQQLAVHTLGGVVTPAQALMKIVPDNHRLVVEALLPNKDIGFVEEGDKAAIKVDTFPYTRYGMLDAEVTNVSDDAIENEQLGLVFPMRLSLLSDSIEVNHRRVRLIPGMAVTVEVKTGQRRLIEYVLAPILRYRSESARER